MSVAIDQRLHRPTYADIEALPQGVNGEIIDGELVVSPRPAPAYARVCTNLVTVLNAPFGMGLGGPGGWQFFFEPELSLGVDPRYEPLIPDIAGWRLETLPDVPDTAQFRVTPDWVCEILSPSTGRHDRGKKLPFYFRAGVGHVWLLDPLQQMLEVFGGTPDDIHLVGVWTSAEHVNAPPFDDLELDLALLWPHPPIVDDAPDTE